MDELIAVLIADNSLRELAGLKTYPLPKIIPINKEITTKIQADKYLVESYQEGQFILKSAFNDKGEAYKAADTILGPTATTATDHPSRPHTAHTTANTTNHGQDRSSSLAFTMTAEESQNPLSVRTAVETHAGSFIVPTIVTKTRDGQETRNVVTFNNRLPTTVSSVNQRLMEIASSATATTATNRDGCPKDAQQGNSQTQNGSYNPGRNYQGDTQKTSYG